MTASSTNSCCAMLANSPRWPCTAFFFGGTALCIPCSAHAEGEHMLLLCHTHTHTRMTACCYCSVPLCQHKRDEVKDAHPTGIASAEKRKRSKPLKDTHPEHRATEHQRTDGRQLQPAAMAARHMQCAFVRIHAVPCRAGVS